MDNNKLKNKIRVIVVEDHPTMRKGIVTTLREDKDGSFEVVGEAETGYQALLLCQEKQPDAMILDLHLTGDMSGLEVISEVRRQKFPFGLWSSLVHVTPARPLVEKWEPTDTC